MTVWWNCLFLQKLLVVSYHQYFKAMSVLRWNSVISILRKIAFLTVLVALFLYGISLFWYLAPIHIKGVEVSLSNGLKADKRIEKTIKNFIFDKIADTIPLLYFRFFIKKDAYQRKLETFSDFYIKKIEIEGFSPKKGILKVKIWTRKAVASLNNKYLLSPEGVIFGYSTPGNVLKIKDFSNKWNYGTTYKSLPIGLLKALADKFNFRSVVVNGTVVTLKGSSFTLTLRKDFLKGKNLQRIENILNNLKRTEGEYPPKVEILGERMVYITINGERSNE